MFDNRIRPIKHNSNMNLGSATCNETKRRRGTVESKTLEERKVDSQIDSIDLSQDEKSGILNFQ